MTIDYTRRARPAPMPIMDPVPPVTPAPAPSPRPVPRPDSDSARPARPGYGIAGLAVKVAVAWFAVEAWTNGTVLGAVLFTVAALLCWAFVRQALRYSLAVAGMTVDPSGDRSSWWPGRSWWCDGPGRCMAGVAGDQVRRLRAVTRAARRPTGSPRPALPEGGG